MLNYVASKYSYNLKCETILTNFEWFFGMESKISLAVEKYWLKFDQIGHTKIIGLSAEKGWVYICV